MSLLWDPLLPIPGATAHSEESQGTSAATISLSEEKHSRTSGQLEENQFYLSFLAEMFRFLALKGNVIKTMGIKTALQSQHLEREMQTQLRDLL